MKQNDRLARLTASGTPPNPLRLGQNSHRGRNSDNDVTRGYTGSSAHWVEGFDANACEQVPGHRHDVRRDGGVSRRRSTSTGTTGATGTAGSTGAGGTTGAGGGAGATGAGGTSGSAGASGAGGSGQGDGGANDVCNNDGQCQTGFRCCYPCGIPGCMNQCLFTDGGRCPLFP
jgi:hypothetical protein